MLVTRPLNYGRAGILATFCTQSNDFAIGYPILLALYSKTHPEYASYLYLMAPISLAILNPIGYILLEISKTNAAITPASPITSGCPQILEGQEMPLAARNRKYLLIMKTTKSILTNPILFMTIFGVIGGFAFPTGLPIIVSGVLKVS